MPPTFRFNVLAFLIALLLAFGVLFYASEMRQGVVNMFEMISARPKPAATPPARAPEVAAKASGVRVIPIGVAGQAAPAGVPASRSQ